jgi:hypothetical protein
VQVHFSPINTLTCLQPGIETLWLVIKACSPRQLQTPRGLVHINLCGPSELPQHGGRHDWAEACRFRRRLEEGEVAAEELRLDPVEDDQHAVAVGHLLGDVHAAPKKVGKAAVQAHPQVEGVHLHEVGGGWGERAKKRQTLSS